MEITLLYTFLSVLFLAAAFKFLSVARSQRRKNLPPSPPALPFIGHLHLVKHPRPQIPPWARPKLGPVFSLRFGSRPVVVVSSPLLRRSVFTKERHSPGQPPQAHHCQVFRLQPHYRSSLPLR
ncbi:unnamed protein product [Thlaspi arvense]|uniref:Cytochrome P450 n=1 Tax=Thlaspi arvense TaxID=13288 RepID=A0AAU9T7G8_THLAR|nr:unnamed protein product [Thlaspi arvense]